jgi:hypothetical protein
MKPQATDPQAVDGWNIDDDPRNNPTFPMRDISRDQSAGLDWQRPPLQVADVEILQSVEHNRLPAVFGTTVPPSGLSGVIRRLAFKRSESDWWHWLLLIAADRINVVEGVLDDLGKGTVPNIAAEMGLGSELKYNKPAVVEKVAATLVVSALAVALLGRRRRAHPRRARKLK